MDLLSAETNLCCCNTCLTAPGTALSNVCWLAGLYVMLLELALPVYVWP